ncbi:helix-turn-helix transcriptional regulator [Paenibacillus hamazuiensis]|uniref:helix-turn-helix transcriptional regulator n=1 Tax=Paenibacillus hamazuiensis TaxID=2936508 RepID=UPI00200FBAE3|nr:YafY family protein [Paenibacillus hamazuiensis]
MAKPKRLIELLMTVNAKRRFTVQELADEFHVSKRTILRDLQELSELGVPLYSEVGAGGGYRVLREKMLPPICFSEEEATAMFFAYQSLEQYSALPFEESSVSALKKFYHYLPAEAKERIQALQNRFMFKVPKHKLGAKYLKPCLEAALRGQVLFIEYDSENGVSKRDIQPIGVYAMNGLWYCPAYCFKSEEMRMFRVDRIVSAEVKNDQSVRREDVRKKTLVDWFSFENQTHEVELEVELTPRGVKKCQSDIWLSSDLHVRSDGTGVIRTTIDRPFIPWAIDFFMGYGTEAVLTKPDFAVEMIKNRLDELRKLYQ